MKNIKDFDTFSGTDGYLIVDGTDENTPGGKKLLSEISGGGITESDLIDALEEISPRFDNHNTVLQGGESAGTRSPISLRFDNTLTALNDSSYPQSTSKILSVKNPVPSTTTASDGDVLTYSDTDGVVWAAPQGDVGNPYTKVEVTPEAAVLNGKMSDYNFLLFDQSVNIANNTFSVIPGGIGYENRENPDEKGNLWSKAIDVFKINLPAGTDFPMAVVEFPLTPNQDASINTIEVYVGSTKLTQIRDVPYREDAIVGNEIYADSGIEHVTSYGSNYWKWENIWDNNLAKTKTAIVNMNNDGYSNPKVQVHIFGSCYRVMASVQSEEIPAS